MTTPGKRTLRYKRSHFATHMPVDYLYSPSHYWIAREEGKVWRVGLTKFAVRMLGEMVDHGFDVEPEAAVTPGQILGWLEGFKAISDIFCIAQGVFRGGNPLLGEKIGTVNKDCYGAGWIYRIEGEPDATCMDVEAYARLLDKTIDRLMEKKKSS